MLPHPAPWTHQLAHPSASHSSGRGWKTKPAKASEGRGLQLARFCFILMAKASQGPTQVQEAGK